jgi:MioC protein
MLGGTEYVAEACEETLNELNHHATVHLSPSFDDIKIENQRWLICTSTHGAGDYPDNIQQFVTDLTNTDRDLTNLKILVIGIGDSNYDTFCLAAKNIEKLLISKGCNKMEELLTLDMSMDIDPEDLSQQWIDQIKDLL